MKKVLIMACTFLNSMSDTRITVMALATAINNLRSVEPIENSEMKRLQDNLMGAINKSFDTDRPSISSIIKNVGVMANTTQLTDSQYAQAKDIATEVRQFIYGLGVKQDDMLKKLQNSIDRLKLIADNVQNARQESFSKKNDADQYIGDSYTVLLHALSIVLRIPDEKDIKSKDDIMSQYREVYSAMNHAIQRCQLITKIDFDALAEKGYEFMQDTTWGRYVLSGANSTRYKGHTTLASQIRALESIKNNAESHAKNTFEHMISVLETMSDTIMDPKQDRILKYNEQNIRKSILEDQDVIDLNKGENNREIINKRALNEFINKQINNTVEDEHALVEQDKSSISRYFSQLLNNAQSIKKVMSERNYEAAQDMSLKEFMQKYNPVSVDRFVGEYRTALKVSQSEDGIRKKVLDYIAYTAGKQKLLAGKRIQSGSKSSMVWNFLKEKAGKNNQKNPNPDAIDQDALRRQTFEEFMEEGWPMLESEDEGMGTEKKVRSKIDKGFSKAIEGYAGHVENRMKIDELNRRIEDVRSNRSYIKNRTLGPVSRDEYQNNEFEQYRRSVRPGYNDGDYYDPVAEARRDIEIAKLNQEKARLLIDPQNMKNLLAAEVVKRVIGGIEKIGNSSSSSSAPRERRYSPRSTNTFRY